MKRNNYDDFQRMWGADKDAPKPKNYAEWNDVSRAEWQQRPIEEVESYYINLKNYIARLKKEHPKPYALLHKKKQWRNGLFEILKQHPVIGKHYRKEPVAKKQKLSSVSTLPRDAVTLAERSNPGTTPLITEVDSMLNELQARRALRASRAAPPPHDEENEDEEAAQ